MSGSVAVLGATGGQGGAVVDALLAQGVPVRAVVRSPGSGRAEALRRRGAEVVAGDMGDAESMTAAFTGVRAAFAVTTPFEEGIDAEVGQGRAIVAAAGAARLPYLVLSSVAGADRETGVPHFDSKHRTEAVLHESGLDWTVVAPTYFFDNILGDTAALRDGRLPLPLAPDQRLQQMARHDLGEFVAHLVRDPGPHVHRRIELAGDEPTPAEMAADVGEALGRQVRPVSVPLSSVYAGSDDMGAMWTFLRDHGYQVDIAALRSAHPDVGWTSFASWVAREPALAG
ncbi:MULTISPECIES: NmrA/HSCARG family protein [unclassified Streptomyces]|uniref:NmrA/HSCARG family protein n=1 Tax=unclassified Streptomyces TaxID=2593676 RepID=UPI0022381427|nr:NmrA/HSCARG family protein [Streptomyces sp. SHP 1-2]MCW5253509.1 NmrA/HSCARG family protein [Streptomyces sp. SHP 1-2]